MADQLTTEQVLLLNNLMYMENEGSLTEIASITEPTTVAEIIKDVNFSKLDNNTDYGSFMTGADWKNIVTAVKNDPQLMNMEIVSTNRDNATGGGGGESALFVDPSTNEAVVVYRGTDSYEWKDDFVGGGKTSQPDGVSTIQQSNALDWYQSLDLDGYSNVTVSGHSKGGNKAKYVAILDDSVDRCLSFDGQGFSDEFYAKYEDAIARNQSKIHNNNVEGDFVNLLLNDIGATTFYKGYDYGKGGFAENHCPNTFLNFGENGTFTMTEGTRDPNMAALDEFLNSYLRTLSPDDKAQTLDLLGQMVEDGFNKADLNTILNNLSNGDNADLAANLLAYTFKYASENDDFLGIVKKVFTDMGWEDYCKFVDVAGYILDWKYFDEVLGFLGKGLDKIPSWMMTLLLAYLYDKTGVYLSEDNIRDLLGILKDVDDKMEDIHIEEGTGADITVLSDPMSIGTLVAGRCEFSINSRNINNALSNMDEFDDTVRNANARLEDIISKLNGINILFKGSLNHISENMEKQEKDYKTIHDTLRNINNSYINAEKNAFARTIQ